MNQKKICFASCTNPEIEELIDRHAITMNTQSCLFGGSKVEEDNYIVSSVIKDLEVYPKFDLYVRVITCFTEEEKEQALSSFLITNNNKIEYLALVNYDEFILLENKNGQMKEVNSYEFIQTKEKVA